MDAFKQKRNLIITIVLLVLLNLVTIFLLWFGNPARQSKLRESKIVEQKNERLQELLKEELGFDEDQIKQFLRLRQDQQEKAKDVQNNIQQIKKQMFDAVLQDNPPEELSDSLLKLSQEKMGELEQLTFDYFLDLRKLCKPEQLDKLKILINDFFHQVPPKGKNEGPPMGERPDGPPPPPPGEHPPI